ncbi:helix-turn-helix domain-containing protein [Sharpea azabuensis]|uniref:helix-turn-helix domain-containing protein n=1 Tax=Sharpea azabuensis TaxID=322505 RepID=UPI00156930B0
MSKNVNYNLGGRVKTLRENRGWSQEKLATKVGVTTAYLGDIERNTKNPTFYRTQYKESNILCHYTHCPSLLYVINRVL